MPECVLVKKWRRSKFPPNQMLTILNKNGTIIKLVTVFSCFSTAKGKCDEETQETEATACNQEILDRAITLF